MNNKKPTDKEAKQAIQTLLKYIGEDLNREGIIDTPKRVIQSYIKFFSGYKQNPKEILSNTFKNTDNYDDIILLKNICFKSYCEHHMVSIIGKANIAYIPDKEIIGISKLVKLVKIFAKKLQTQEHLTIQITKAIENVLQPKGVAVIIKSFHECLGIHEQQNNTNEAYMITKCMKGLFKDNNYNDQLLSLINNM